MDVLEWPGIHCPEKRTVPLPVSGIDSLPQLGAIEAATTAGRNVADLKEEA
jgi:hypothetical protein